MTSELIELNDVARELEGAHPGDVVRWAYERHGDGLVVTSSFGDAILAHVASSAVPGIEIVLLDTQYLFAETRWYAEQLRRRVDINLRVVRPDESVIADDLWQTDPTGCCRIRNVEPLERLLAARTAWVTGLRRSDSPSRRSTPMVSWDIGRSVVKVNPLAAFTDDDLALYTRRSRSAARRCASLAAAGQTRRLGRLVVAAASSGRLFTRLRYPQPRAQTVRSGRLPSGRLFTRLRYPQPRAQTVRSGRLRFALAAPERPAASRRCRLGGRW